MVGLADHDISMEQDKKTAALISSSVKCCKETHSFGDAPRGGGNLLKLSGLSADVKGTKCVFAAGGRPKSASGNMNV